MKTAEKLGVALRPCKLKIRKFKPSLIAMQVEHTKISARRYWDAN